MRVLIFALLAGCTPLTFSNVAPIDFDRYRSVYVEGGGTGGVEVRIGGLEPREYLIQELRAESGFERVERDPFEADARLALGIDLFLDRGFGSENDEFVATVVFELYSPDGRLIDRGSVQDESTSPREAVEDALDEVVHHYLPSYRL